MSTTPSSRRHSCGSATRCTCSARSRDPRSSGSSTRSVAGTTAGSGSITCGARRTVGGAPSTGPIWGAPAPRGRCPVCRPDIGGLLPVYVYDDYEGFTVKTFENLTDAELAHYTDSNVA